MYFLLFTNIILYLFSQNNLLFSYTCLISLAIGNAFLTVGGLLIRLLVRSNQKKCVIMYIFICLFFLLVPLGRLLFTELVARNADLFGYVKKFTLLGFAALLGIMVWWVYSCSESLCKKLNKIFDVFTLILFLVFTGNVLVVSVVRFYFLKKISQAQLPVAGKIVQKYPNVYHILLDAHSSNFVLKKYYQFDNLKFYQCLTERKFYTNANSFSQYPATQMSIASMLNLDYLPNCGVSAQLLRRKRYDNRVFSEFYAHNFDIHVFSHTLQISYGKQFGKRYKAIWAPIWLWMQHSPVKWFSQKTFQKFLAKDHIKFLDLDLQDLIFAKENFGSNNNLFYAHILCPHAPFIYDGYGKIDVTEGLVGVFTNMRGRLASDEKELFELKTKYLNTLKCIDSKILEVIDRILIQYPENNKPIIVLHSDHGTCLTTISPLLFDSHKLLPQQLNAEQEQLYGNLLAIYCPQGWSVNTVPLSLVNLYRFIFNNLFDSNYKYLKNYCCVKD